MYELEIEDTDLIRQATDADLPALVAQLARKLAAQIESDPVAMQDRIAELVDDVRECRCAELRCSHNCNYCTPDGCDFENRAYWCEDCFAFVPDYPTFCHCGQRIIITFTNSSRC
ncbi:MAG: hypothetical protein OXF79_06500 [Chloroflexi bacterium]|nr:hypothetical protein [Chloroflexota bacterium]